MEVLEYMGAFSQDFWAGRGIHPELWNFYNELVNVTLQFVSETWVMNLRIGRTLWGFHKQCGLPYGRNATEAVHT